MDRLWADHPRLQVAQETIHGMRIDVNDVLTRLAVEGETPGGFLQALREDLEEVREGQGEDLATRQEALGPLVVCQVALVVRIGSWTCWKLSARHRGSKLTTSGTGVMVTAKLVSRSAGISPRSPLRVDQF